LKAAVPSRPDFAGAVNRSLLLLGLFLLATANAFAGFAVREIETNGVAAATANLFGLSAILWVALAAGLKLLADDKNPRPLREGDRVIAAFVFLCALLPWPAASSAGLTALGLWAIFTSAPDTPPRRAGIIFLAMTGSLIWGRLLLGVFSRPLLDLDALFVSHLLGAVHEGNMIWSEAGRRVVVAPGCSSIQGMSLALVFWATVNQYFRVGFGWRAAGYCAAAVAATIAINVIRIAGMLQWPEYFDIIHTGWGYHLLMWTTLVLVVAICLHGARREISSLR
jgi:exosortase/archaeosortase family protein